MASSPPTFLVRIARAHSIDAQMKRARDAFEAMHSDEFEPDREACVVCESRFAVVESLSQDPRCECLAHRTCKEELREGTRTQRAHCSVCLALFGIVPSPPVAKKRRLRVLCGTPMTPSEHCCLPRGHLGNCS
jgi:hypothetical protein